MFRKTLGAAALLVCAVVVAGPALADEYAAIRDKLELCFGCHGKNGASTQPRYPILAGQHFYYLYVQLRDFKAGRRRNEEMDPIVADLKKEQMQLLAKFFSEQKWPRVAFQADPAKVKVGESVAVSGECTSCHLGGYEGNSRVPRVAGQHLEYLTRTMLDFKARKRQNSSAMSSLMDVFTESQIEAMAELMAGQ